MPKFTVYFTTTASASVEVEIPQKTIDEEGVHSAVADLVESGLIDTPGICARCGGWGQTYSLELSGEWDTHQATDEDGKVVYGEGQES